MTALTIPGDLVLTLHPRPERGETIHSHENPRPAGP
jgi:hypothetical protein